MHHPFVLGLDTEGPQEVGVQQGAQGSVGIHAVGVGAVQNPRCAVYQRPRPGTPQPDGEISLSAMDPGGQLGSGLRDPRQGPPMLGFFWAVEPHVLVVSRYGEAEPVPTRLPDGAPQSISSLDG